MDALVFLQAFENGSTYNLAERLQRSNAVPPTGTRAERAATCLGSHFSPISPTGTMPSGVQLAVSRVVPRRVGDRRAPDDAGEGSG
jgi:hypothetical protein